MSEKKWSRMSYIQQTTKLQPMLHKALKDLSETLHWLAPTTALFFHMYAIRSWLFVRFVTTHT